MEHKVVVTGIGMVTPVGLSTESTWEAIVAGQSKSDLLLPGVGAGCKTRINLNSRR